MRRDAAAGFVVAAAVLLLSTGCTSTVHLNPAVASNTVACASVTVRLPKRLSGLEERDTDAQSSAAWGDPVAVFERCGISSPRVSPIQCLTFGDVDWLVDTSNKHYIRALTYGRSPAVEVIMDPNTPAPGNYLEDLAGAVKQLPAKQHCL